MWAKLFLGPLPLLGTAGEHFWYIVPLVLSVSLVYGATRHERMRVIAEHAVRGAIWITSFIAILFCVSWLVSWML